MADGSMIMCYRRMSRTIGVRTVLQSLVVALIHNLEWLLWNDLRMFQACELGLPLQG
jgi:hypothetical protein